MSTEFKLNSGAKQGCSCGPLWEFFEGRNYLNALAVLSPTSPLLYTRLVELCIFGSGDEEEIPVDARNRSPAYQPASIHFTDQATVIGHAMQSLDGNLRYCHTFRYFDTKWDD
jgi:hypothetical protein